MGVRRDGEMVLTYPPTPRGSIKTPSLGNSQCENDRAHARLMQRTMKAGPSRRSLSLLASGHVVRRVHVLLMHVGRQRLGEDIGHVLTR
eukprot:1488542-Pleurochrysis_carterae.AAC.1